MVYSSTLLEQYIGFSVAISYQRKRADQSSGDIKGNFMQQLGKQVLQLSRTQKYHQFYWKKKGFCCLPEELPLTVSSWLYFTVKNRQSVFIITHLLHATHYEPYLIQVMYFAVPFSTAKECNILLFPFLCVFRFLSEQCGNQWSSGVLLSESILSQGR